MTITAAPFANHCPHRGHLMPRLLNYVVAIYLIVVGLIGLNGIYHFIH